MSWGTDLWDQYDSIALHTQKGIEFLERYGSFVDQRSKIEQEYANKLRRLVKTFLPKKKDEDDSQLSYTRAYRSLLDELGDQAGQHELIAENLSTQVVQELNALVKQIKDDRRKHLSEGARIQAQLQSSLSLLMKTKEKYEKAFGASERALDAYHKADADLNLSRAEVEKQRTNATQKGQQHEDAKNEYANQLQKTNQAQREHYERQLPEVFRQLQNLDEHRIGLVSEFMLKSVATERNAFPIVNKCLDGIESAARAIDPSQDSRLVVEKYKSGFNPPCDLPFEDLTNLSHDNSSINGSIASVANEKSSKSILGTITGGRVKKRSGILALFANPKSPSSPSVSSTTSLASQDDFSDLPPNQRRKKLQTKLDEINSKISQETAARDGLMKMKQVYEANAALGDPMSLQGQLTENGHKLDKLRAELKRYQGLLDSLEGKIDEGSPSARHSAPVSHTASSSSSSTPMSKSNSNRRSSVSDGNDSLSRSESESSVANGQQQRKNNETNNNIGTQGSGPVQKVRCRILSPVAKPATGKQSHDSSDGRVSSLPTAAGSSSSCSYESTMSSSKEINVDDHTHEEEDEMFDAEPLPILGRCRALYTFEVTSEGSIRMDAGDELWVIETDQGDGWTRVRRTTTSSDDAMPEGFVPSSYLDVYTMFDAPQHAI